MTYYRRFRKFAIITEITLMFCNPKATVKLLKPETTRQRINEKVILYIELFIYFHIYIFYGTNSSAHFHKPLY